MSQQSSIPQHLGIIMDGNRRWARQQGLPSWRGHAKGQDVLHRISKEAFNMGIKYVTVYAFSTENWKRDKLEVGYLMRHVGLAVRKYIQYFVEGGVRVLFLGNKATLPKTVRQAIDLIESKTAGNASATLAICFNYGGMQEITDALKQIVENNTPLEQVTPELIANNLYEPHIPPLDLVIRTGGEQRISNFMLWRSAYSEFYFTDTLWPNFSEADLQLAIKEYSARQRRFGS